MVVFRPKWGQPLKWLNGKIDIVVQVDTGLEGEVGALWSDGYLWSDGAVWGSNDPSWFDISGYVDQVTIHRGKARWDESFNVGTCTIRVDNRSGIFHPNFEGSTPFILPFEPGRRMRVGVRPDPSSLTVFPLFTGTLDGVNGSYQSGGYDIMADLICVDFMAEWQGFNPPALETATGVQTADVRINAALDRMDWPVEMRDIETSAITIQTSNLAQSVNKECWGAADGAGGSWFCGVDGKAVYRDRDWLVSNERSITVQGYLGYDEVPSGENAHLIEPPSDRWERGLIRNHISFAKVGGEIYRAIDLVSVQSHQPQTYQRTDLSCSTQAQVEFLAERYLASYRDLRVRVPQVTIAANDDPLDEDLNRMMWASTFGDLVQIKVATPYGWFYEKQAHIFGISHKISGTTWEVSFNIDDAAIYHNLEESS